MPLLGPIKRRDLVRYLASLGFEGPFVGGRHEFMRRAGTRLVLPNAHRSDISRELLGDLLRQAGISREEWENL